MNEKEVNFKEAVIKYRNNKSKLNLEDKVNNNLHVEELIRRCDVVIDYLKTGKFKDVKFNKNSEEA